uniref:G-protein coupled receptors family 1 profile domain-containing protein n=1 Tax=Lepisosteus oculatus TaxID=7918 RepID=W5MYJ4_LEPOC
LAVMSVSRYLRKPITHSCVVVFLLGWGFRAMIIPTILTVRLTFCGPDKILHCFCGHSVVVRLACATVVINSILGLTLALVVVLIPLFLILLSYVMIDGRTKAFSTCTSHLLVICVFFLTATSTFLT